MTEQSQRGGERPSGAWRQVAVALLVVLAMVATLEGPASAASADLGWEGPSFQGASGSPSGSKPQSKVWFNDGLWWATLFDTGSGDFHIFRLDATAGAWQDTGTLVDTRSNSRSDALWTGDHLYIANHVFSESSNSSGNPALLRRYSYDASSQTYAPDPGFPVAINDVRSETLVIDQEPSGRLWATWVQDGVVTVNHTMAGDTEWATPFALPGAPRTTDDDISSLMAFGNERIGVLWSDQDDERMYFAQHLDGAGPQDWMAPEVAFAGRRAADDHINLASTQDAGGRVLAAVKTSASGSDVLTHLLDRDPVTGTWTSHPFGRGSDNHTRPIVVVDAEHRQVHMFASSGQSGGSIYEKVAPLDDIDFPAGKGTAVLTDASSADINNATSTKAPVSSASGLVVVATNDTTRQYWTHFDPLGQAPPPPPPPPPPPEPPVASFTRTPVTGTAPLDVAFADASTGSPAAWRWEFGDGGSSTQRSPSHRYEAAGTFDVTLTVTNEGGSDATTQVGSVTVTADVPPDPSPDPSAVLVAQLYQDLLGRSVDPAGLEYWAGRLTRGETTARGLAATLVGSSEVRGHVVDELYQRVLDRLPGSDARSYRVDQLRELSRERVEGEVVASSELYQRAGGVPEGYVDAVYSRVLGRPADPSGAAWWTPRATTLAGRRAMADTFLAGSEHRRHVVEDVYRQLLGRTPDASGLAYWVDLLGRGVRQESLAASLAGSPEYAGRADRG